MKYCHSELVSGSPIKEMPKQVRHDKLPVRHKINRRNKMKKLILTLLIGGFIMTGAFAKTAFIYFSATGTTERMAKNILKICWNRALPRWRGVGLFGVPAFASIPSFWWFRQALRQAQEPLNHRHFGTPAAVLQSLTHRLRIKLFTNIQKIPFFYNAKEKRL